MDTQIDLDRMYYVFLRKTTGCPAVISSKFPNGAYYVETRDGSVFIEEVVAPSVWDAKSQCVLKWAEQNS